jgi:hypothetical protein
MKIFIRGNGGAFSRDDLTAFVRRGLRGPWYTGFRQSGDIVQCQIVRAMDRAGRHIEYHGLVEVRPTRIGWQLMSRLNGQRLHGRAVEVRKWFERNAGGSSDRRQAHDLTPFPAARNRRKPSERRRLVRLQLLHDLPDAVLGFADEARRIA